MLDISDPTNPTLTGPSRRRFRGRALDAPGAISHFLRNYLFSRYGMEPQIDRIYERLLFRSLGRYELHEIVDILLRDVTKRLENLNIEFAPDAVSRLAEIAWQVNEKTENIGARRLHTVLERLLEEVSFSAGDLASSQEGNALVIDAAYVNEHLGELAVNEDLSRYIL